MRHLSPELATTDPDAYLAAVAQHMAETTEQGALLWNNGIAHGTLDLTKVELNTGSWHSQSNGAGRLILGTTPMNEREKAAILFGGEGMSYADEVSHRLLHELGHGAVYLAQHDPHMSALGSLANQTRRDSENGSGFSALGSLAFYSPPEKWNEDTTELLTMRSKSSEHLEAYLQFLADPDFEHTRAELGLVGLDPDHAVFLAQIVESALDEALAKPVSA